jgi:hypothetical protein
MDVRQQFPNRGYIRFWPQGGPREPSSAAHLTAQRREESDV